VGFSSSSALNSLELQPQAHLINEGAEGMRGGMKNHLQDVEGLKRGLRRSLLSFWGRKSTSLPIPFRDFGWLVIPFER